VLNVHAPVREQTDKFKTVAHSKKPDLRRARPKRLGRNTRLSFTSEPVTWPLFQWGHCSPRAIVAVAEQE